MVNTLKSSPNDRSCQRLAPARASPKLRPFGPTLTLTARGCSPGHDRAPQSLNKKLATQISSF